MEALSEIIFRVHFEGGRWTGQELCGHGLSAAENRQRVEGVFCAHRAIYQGQTGGIRVANDGAPGLLIDSKIMVELKILVIILCHDS